MAQLGNVSVGLPSAIPVQYRPGPEDVLMQMLGNVGSQAAGDYISAKMPLNDLQSSQAGYYNALSDAANQDTAIAIAELQQKLGQVGLAMTEDGGLLDLQTGAPASPEALENSIPPEIRAQIQESAARVAEIMARAQLTAKGLGDLDLAGNPTDVDYNYNPDAPKWGPSADGTGTPPPPETVPPPNLFVEVAEGGIIPNAGKITKAAGGGLLQGADLRGQLAAGGADFWPQLLFGKQPFTRGYADAKFWAKDQISPEARTLNAGNEIVERFNNGEITEQEAQQALRQLRGR